MRRIPAYLSALALGGLGAIVPATSAHADNWTCSDNYTAAAYGYMYAYQDHTCHGGVIGYSNSWDSDWGNSNGPFQGADTNSASSVLNKGSITVKFFNGTGQDWDGGYVCLTKNEAYATNIADNYFTGGGSISVTDKISSHKWVTNDSCAPYSWLT
ncbi:hypothetical protein G6045_36340 [Streptomyces sp. YC504]|uniref:Peptidase inhibitor family I36 protein n=1 Tax=Streptomyces mesophilus TaxID=1775132 RepID=A0A6G4XV81_9ACTN|nr:hypothetical protein [Streptomyces mesophilus]NGO81092.1 hypothetical protein [Streptomyces mesophilus]